MTEKRPWYKVRRVWGGVLGGAAIVETTIPGAPVLFAVGAVSITTVTVSTLLGLVATGVFGYGQGAKIERSKTKEEEE